jgi:hypothetical protein
MKQDQYDPSEDYRLPWWVSVLDRPPIELDDTMSDEALASELAERLEALPLTATQRLRDGKNWPSIWRFDTNRD